MTSTPLDESTGEAAGQRDETPLERLRRTGQEALHPAGEVAEAKQHERGKRTARERIELLLDHGSFVELDRFVTHRVHGFGLEDRVYLGDGVITGYGMVDER